MSTENVLQKVTREAGGTIRARRFVKDAPGGKVVECDTAGEASCGISQYAADTTDHQEVTLLRGGDIIYEAGGVITDVNPLIATDSQGRGVVAVPGDAILMKGVNGSSAGAAGQKATGTWFDEPQEILS
jgi:hypothetical protein